MVVALCLTIITSCIQREEVNYEESGRVGKESLKLNFKFNLVEQKSRAAVDEILVRDVNLYFVNSAGYVVEWIFHQSGGEIVCELIKERSYTVYAIANAGYKIEARSRDEIERLEIAFSHSLANMEEYGVLLMCGKSSEGVLTDGDIVNIDLQRALSKIVLKCDYSQLNSDVEIEVKRVMLKNVPSGTLLYGPNRIASKEGVTVGREVIEPAKSELQEGIVLYQFENMQGTLLASNKDETLKLWPEGSLYSDICSYLEMEAQYSSARKEGKILYRFYLGKDMTSNFDVERNTQYTVNLNFRGDGAVDENSWRVDNSEIVDLVTSLELAPDYHKFFGLEGSLPIVARIMPLTAANKILRWHTSDESVASVTDEGIVSPVGYGNCNIVAETTDGSGIQAISRIDVVEKIPVDTIILNPPFMFILPESTYQMEALIYPEDASIKDLIWTSADTTVATVDSKGLVKSINEGVSIIMATSVDDTTKSGMAYMIVSPPTLEISPVEITLFVGEKANLNYSIFPSAPIRFESEDSSIASVMENVGVITAHSPGKVRIKAMANDIVKYCEVTVRVPEIQFAEEHIVMYDGEIRTIPMSKYEVYNNDMWVSFSPEGILEIEKQIGSNLEVKALREGVVTIIAEVYDGNTTTCEVTVEKLRIVPDEDDVVTYKHFFTDIGYKIYPDHAAALLPELTIPEGAKSYIVQPDSENSPARIMAIGEMETPVPLTLSISGRQDVCATIYCTAKSPSIKERITAVVNMGHQQTVEELLLDLPPQAVPDYTIEASPANKNGTPGDGIIVDLPNSRVLFNNPCRANGLYNLKVSYVGDDGYCSNNELVCDIEVYETIYLVGVSKTDNTSKLSSNPDIYRYQNEIMGVWLAHPNSLFYQDGIVEDLGLSYIYDGEVYTDSHTGVYKEYEFTFLQDEYYQYALDEGAFIYNGKNRPLYYHEYFALKPGLSTPYHISSNGNYHYIYSRQFMSGFSNLDSPDWDKIFDYVY